MSEKLKFISVVIFAADNHQVTLSNPHRHLEIYVPVDAISHLTLRETGNPRGGYSVHLKSNYPLAAPFPVKSMNISYLSQEQVEIIKLA